MNFDREAMIQLVYRLQVDLKILSEYLARTEEPVLPMETVASLYLAQSDLEGVSARH